MPSSRAMSSLPRKRFAGTMPGRRPAHAATRRLRIGSTASGIARAGSTRGVASARAVQALRASLGREEAVAGLMPLAPSVAGAAHAARHAPAVRPVPPPGAVQQLPEGYVCAWTDETAARPSDLGLWRAAWAVCWTPGVVSSGAVAGSQTAQRAEFMAATLAVEGLASARPRRRGMVVTDSRWVSTAGRPEGRAGGGMATFGAASARPIRGAHGTGGGPGHRAGTLGEQRCS